MKALILGQNNKMPCSEDCMLAYCGFESMYEDCTTIETSGHWLLKSAQEFRQYDVCVGDVRMSHLAIFKMNINFKNIDCYPHQLASWLKRDIHISTLKEVMKTDFNKRAFIKPVKPKKTEPFFSSLTKNNDNYEFYLREIIGLDDNEEMYVSEIVKFASEWRVYVYDFEIQQICFYKGDPKIFPEIIEIKDMIKEYKEAPCCYALDVGVLFDHSEFFNHQMTALVEVNDFYALDNYGLNSEKYAFLLHERWKQIKG